MPKTEIEIFRTRTVTYDESVVVELDVPKSVLNEGDVLSWVDNIMTADERELSAAEKKVRSSIDVADWEPSDEDESSDYTEAIDIS